MSTRGLLAFRFRGRNYITYNHSDSYPKCLGARIITFAQEHLSGEAAIQAFGRKVAALEWVEPSREARSFHPQGAELLNAIAGGRITRILSDDNLFNTCLDGEFAYVLDLDERVLEFWDIPEHLRCASFPLATLSLCAVDIMECERRR